MRPVPSQEVAWAMRCVQNLLCSFHSQLCRAESLSRIGSLAETLTDESGLVCRQRDLLDIQVAQATGESTECIFAIALLRHLLTHAVFPFSLAVRPSKPWVLILLPALPGSSEHPSGGFDPRSPRSCSRDRLPP